MKCGPWTIPKVSNGFKMNCSVINQDLFKRTLSLYDQCVFSLWHKAELLHYDCIEDVIGVFTGYVIIFIRIILNAGSKFQAK